MTPGYWVRRLDELPLVPTDDPDDFDWYPIQHHLGLGAFGVNGLGGDAGTTLVAEHDERESNQEELYVVVEGTVRVVLDEEEVQASGVSSSPFPIPESDAPPSRSKTRRSCWPSARRRPRGSRPRGAPRTSSGCHA